MGVGKHVGREVSEDFGIRSPLVVKERSTSISTEVPSLCSQVQTVGNWLEVCTSKSIDLVGPGILRLTLARRAEQSMFH